MDSLDLNELKDEVARLIASTQQAFAYNLADANLQQKLNALLALKKVLDTQTLPPQQLEAIRNQIRALAPAPAPTPTPSMPAFAPPASVPPVISTPQQPPTPAFQPPVSAPPLNLAQMLANFRPGAPVVAVPSPAPAPAPAPVVAAAPAPSPAPPNLADLIARLATPPQQSSTPVAAPFYPPPFPGSTTISTPVQMPAIPAPAPSATPVTPAPAPANLAQLLASLSKPPAATSAAPSHSFNPALPTQVQGLSQLLSQHGGTAAVPTPNNPSWLLNALSGLPNANTPVNATPLGSEPMTRQSSAPVNFLNEVELTTASMKQ